MICHVQDGDPGKPVVWFKEMNPKAGEPGVLRTGGGQCPSPHSQAGSKFNLCPPFCSTQALGWLDGTRPRWEGQLLCSVHHFKG